MRPPRDAWDRAALLLWPTGGRYHDAAAPPADVRWRRNRQSVRCAVLGCQEWENYGCQLHTVLQRVRMPPSNRRSSRQQSERMMEATTSSEAPREKGRLGRFSVHAGCNASERRAGPETASAEADPPCLRGRAPSTGQRTPHASVGSAGVVAAAAWKRGTGATWEVLSVAWHAPTGAPRGAGRAGRVAEGLVVPRKPGDAGGAKEPRFESDAGGGIWKMPWCGVSAAHAKRLVPQDARRIHCGWVMRTGLGRNTSGRSGAEGAVSIAACGAIASLW